VFHSDRKASTGLIETARLAGRTAANIATIIVNPYFDVRLQFRFDFATHFGAVKQIQDAMDE
jgi:hypothetical protein